MKNKNHLKHLELLEWDTNFFKKRICRIHGELNSVVERAEILQQLEDNHIELAYYSSPFELGQSMPFDDAYTLELVDKKVTFLKPIDASTKADNRVVSYGKTDTDQKLLDLSIESGVHSRFKVDPKIGQENFEELYKRWIIYSVEKKLAKEVLVYVENNDIVGFVTVGEKESRGDIGIIAVDAAFRGKGIGKSLMHAAEHWFVQNTTFDKMQVVTQRDNIPSCSLYQSCGFHIDRLEYFYHLWKM